MTPIQQLMLGVGASKKTYVDEVFASNVYVGDGGSSRTITTGIDISTEGGATWLRDRGGNVGQMMFDTARGARKRLVPSGENAEVDPGGTNGHTGWTTTGFTLGTNNNTENWSNYEYINWNFRKAKGFFDVVTYTGNGTTGQYISHNLGCVPGCIMIKCRSAETGWQVYHVSSEITDEHGQGHGADDYELILSSNSASSQQTQWLSSTAAPTASNFHLNKDSWGNNKNGETYVAYVFAAGRNTSSTARCVQFDGSNDELTIDDHADLELGNSDFTIELWLKSSQATNGYRTAIAKWVDSGNQRSWNIRYCSQDIGTGWVFFYSLDGSSYSGANGGTLLGGDVGDGKWHHIAVTRTGGNIRTFTDGVLNNTVSESGTFYDGTGDVTIGGQGGNYFRGQLSNVRLIKGTALYTSGFTPPTGPLTNVTNTKLLCCNNLSATGSTVTPGTISKSSYPYSIPESPFKDSAAQKFGDSKGNIIHCGSYIGGGNTVRNIDLGWEPQWLLIKDTTTASNWILYDNIRGLNGKDISDKTLFTNDNTAEVSDTYFNVQPWGFRVTSNDNEVNKDNGRFVFIAIRRPDGYVGKPIELGTDVFNIVDGRSSPEPTLVTNFVADYGIFKHQTAVEHWFTTARLLQGKYLKTNNDDSELSTGSRNFDYNDGWANGNLSGYRGWSWKRHAGFDVVQYRCLENIDTGVQMISHSMNAVPEMMWIKNRSSGGKSWAVYHKDMNGGTNPHNYYMNLDESSGETSDSTYFGAAPTATAFPVHRSNALTGHHDHKFIAMLFSSVPGVSKCGTYTGSSSSFTVNLGFQPRMIIIKGRASSRNWIMFETFTGWAKTAMGGAETTHYWALNDNGGTTVPAVVSGSNIVCYPVSNGVYFTGLEQSLYGQVNANGEEYIYYAHA